MPDLQPHGLKRMLTLRRFRFFENADLDELATIAENLVERTIPAGTVLASAGSRLQGVHLVLDGQIATDPHAHTVVAGQPFGALEVFANREATLTAVAATELRTLYMSASDVGEVLEDNFGVLLAALRELASRVAAVGHATMRSSLAFAPSHPLGLVERLILLRQPLPFAAARLQALATLAHASDEVMWPGQTVIARAGEPATSGFVLIDGGVLSTHGNTTQLLEAGGPIGHLETLAGLPYRATIETTTPVRVLRSDAAAMLDVIEDHTDVGLAMLATLAGALLDQAAHVN
jgi:CRP-like cAMP-binding protein